MAPTGVLNLDSLADGIPVLLPEAAGFYKLNCMVCLDNQGHSSGVSLSVERKAGNADLRVEWQGVVDTQMRMAHGDLIKATEHAGCAIGLLLVRELTKFTAFEQSAIGTTVDYYLARRRSDDTLIFNRAARLEASGILKEAPGNTVDGRVSQKRRRLKPDSLPALITVVEFGTPKSRMIEP